MRKVPAPKALPESMDYWKAADEGVLLVKRCSACGRHHHYPRSLCPFCLSEATEWRTAAGTATLYSWSTMGQGDDAYTLAYVTLAEGPTMLTNIVGCDPATLAVGQPLRVVFTKTDGHAVPMFTPA